MAKMIDITNLSDAGIDALLAVASGDDYALTEPLSNADVDAVKAAFEHYGHEVPSSWAYDAKHNQR